MGRIVAVEHVSLDGVMQGPGRPDEDTRGGFTAGGWAHAAFLVDPVAQQAVLPERPAAAMLFGRRTYLDLVGFWLAAPPNPFADLLRAAPKHVATRTLQAPLPHPSSHVMPDLLTGAAALRRDVDGDIVVLGSGDVVHQLIDAGLVDAFVLTIFPVVLGTGMRLFTGTPVQLDVTRTITTPTGIVVLHADLRR